MQLVILKQFQEQHENYRIGTTIRIYSLLLLSPHSISNRIHYHRRHRHCHLHLHRHRRRHWMIPVSVVVPVTVVVLTELLQRQVRFILLMLCVCVCASFQQQLVSILPVPPFLRVSYQAE